MTNLTHNLICTRCGYSLQGLLREGVCPECGLEIIRSIDQLQEEHHTAPLKLRALILLCCLCLVRDAFVFSWINQGKFTLQTWGDLYWHEIGILILFPLAMPHVNLFKQRHDQIIALMCLVYMILVFLAGLIPLLQSCCCVATPLYLMCRMILWVFILNGMATFAAGIDKIRRISLFHVSLALTLALPLVYIGVFTIAEATRVSPQHQFLFTSLLFAVSPISSLCAIAAAIMCLRNKRTPD